MLLPFFTWLQELPLIASMQQSIWVQPTTNVLHLLSVAVFAGAVLIVDLRLMGRGMTGQPLAQVAGDAKPWLVGSFVAVFLSGLPQFATLAIRNYYNDFFWFKMTALLLAIIYTFAIRPRFTSPSARLSAGQGMVAGLVSMVLWLAVIVPARLIGLS